MMSGEMLSIPEFYSGRSVFITGATGFMGKVLLEKLLRSCPSIECIYILVRPKKGQAAHERILDMLNTQLFDHLREKLPDFKSKVIGVHGDILEPGLGLSDKDTQTLTENVSVVFHSAATVKFDERLKLSIQMNVLGVRKLLELCHKMIKLEAMIHVSTAYCNCDKEVVMETIYPPPVHPHRVIAAAEWMEDDIVEMLTPLLVKPRPNTYTYTKAMAEYILLKERGGLPCAVVRPSIVGASLQEPLPGWVDNFNGPTGLLAAIGKGLLRRMQGNCNGTSDIIPVDIATNLIIVAAWSLAMERPSHIPVYNCTTGQLNRVTWGQVERASVKYFMKTPVAAPIRVPAAHFTRSKLLRDLMFWLDHMIPAWILDLGLWIQGRKPMVTRLQNRLWRSVGTLEYFTTNQWVFTNQNVVELFQKLQSEDQKEFNFDVTCINWAEYLENYCLGVKRFALNEDMTAIDAARQAMNRLVIVNRLLSVVALVLALRFLMPRLDIARRLWYYAISLAVRILKQLPGFARS